MTTMLNRRRPALLSVLVVAAIGVAVAGCGSSSNTPKSNAGSSSSSSSGGGAYGAPATTTSSTSSSGGGTTVDLTSAKLGKYLVDSKGRTLYLFAADTGTSSTCYSACAGAWPPLTTTGAPKAGSGVTASLLGTTKRHDGTTEVTYAGHPLYYYAGDTGPGQTTGQALPQFGAPWYVVAANGKAIK